MKQLEGKLIEKEGEFFIEMGEGLFPLEANPLGDTATLKANVGQMVGVVMSEPSVISIFTRKNPIVCYRACFICYYPIDIFKFWKINPAIKEMNLKVFLEEGLITQEVFDQQMQIR